MRIVDPIEKLREAIREGERMATLSVAAKILRSLDPHNKNPTLRKAVNAAVKEVWEQRDLRYWQEAQS